MNVVKARVGRILGHLASYRDLTDASPGSLPCLQDLALQADEVVFGAYENRPAELDESIVVTSRGLHVRRNQAWEPVQYVDIVSIDTPQDKAGVTGLVVHLDSGRVMEVPVRGGTGRYSDAWEFLRFLDRVTADLRHDNLHG